MNFKEFLALEEKFNGMRLYELKQRFKELKDSGPHSAHTEEFREMNDIDFAIRMKTGWGKISNKYK